MDIQTALGRLDPWLDELDAIVRRGFAIYRDYPAAVLVEHDSRAAAACVFCHMLREAERRFSEDRRRGVGMLAVRGLNLIRFEDFALVRFKKMDEDGNTRNYPTEQAISFDAQEPLPDLPLAAVRLSVGYVPDATATAIEQVVLAKPNGRFAEWAAAINPAAAPRWTDITRQATLGEDFRRPERRGTGP